MNISAISSAKTLWQIELYMISKLEACENEEKEYIMKLVMQLADVKQELLKRVDNRR